MAALPQSATEAINTADNISPVEPEPSDTGAIFSFNSDEENENENNNNSTTISDDSSKEIKKLRDAAIRREILPSQSMEDYFKESIKNEQMHIFIPILTQIFDKYGGKTVDDIKARIIDYECFETTLSYLNKLSKLIKQLRNMYNNTIIKKKKKNTNEILMENDSKTRELMNDENDRNKSDTEEVITLSEIESDKDDNIANIESLDIRSEEYKEATQGNQYIKPGDRIYLTRVEGSHAHRKECEKLLKTYLVSMGLGGNVGNKLFDLMYNYKVYEPLHLRSKLTMEQFDQLYNEVMDSHNINLVGRQKKYLEGTRYGWTKEEIDESFKNKKRKNTKTSDRKRTNTNSSNISTDIVSSPRSVGSKNRSRSRSRAAHTSGALDTVVGSIEHKRACTKEMCEFLIDNKFIDIPNAKELFEIMYENFSIYEASDLRSLSKGNVERLVKQALNSNKFVFSKKRGELLKNYCLGNLGTPRANSNKKSKSPRVGKNRKGSGSGSGTISTKIVTPKGSSSKSLKNGSNTKDTYYTASDNPKDQLRVYLETEANLGHIFCQVLSDVLITNYGITSVESFKKKCKSDKKRTQMIQEAKKIHTTGGIANFRGFENFVKKLR